MRVAEPAGPIADTELPALFVRARGASKIALAVSGGADLLALLDCADRWRRSDAAAPELLVLTVDHGLRPESRKEAKAVVALATARGIAAKILTWSGQKPRGDVESAARAARYRLLLAATVEAGARHLLVAHHRDDQAETVLLRLARGSGVFGLAAMREELRAGAVTILRPLIDMPRSRLQETVAVAGMTPVEDPMNTDPRFARARLRRIMPLLAADGIDPAGLAATARRLASAAAAIDAAADALIAAAASVDTLAVATVDAALLLSAPAEVRSRVLVRLLLAVGGDAYPPRQMRLQALLRDLENPPQGRFKRTLAGTVIEKRRNGLLFYRETGRSGLPELAVGRGYSGVWDHRFHVSVGGRVPRGLRLAALGAEGRLEAGLKHQTALAAAIEALPAFRLAGRVVAVPSLGHMGRVVAGADIMVRPMVAERLREPPLFPDFLGPEEA